MKYTIASLKHLFLATCVSSCALSYAIDSAAIQEQANTSIAKLYHTLNTMPKTSMAERINWFSKHFLGVVYLNGSLGEGPDAKYDQYPQYRVDAFDCDTYVNTVLALALANSPASFHQCLKAMRYKDGNINYVNRNHFTSIDWNNNNEARGVLKDITLNIKDKNNQPVALYAVALINKPSWYTHKTLNIVRLQQEDKIKQEHLLAELKKEGRHLEITQAKTPYLPLTALFKKDGTPNLHLFAQIPLGAIIEIVRPNWDLRKEIGTALNISHMGLAIRVKDQLYFRQASSTYGKVVDVPLVDYLKGTLKSPTIKGINVQVVVPGKPLGGEC